MQRSLALGFFACCLIVPALVACGGDSDSDPTPGTTSSPATSATAATTTAAANPGTSPLLDEPASKYAIMVEDLGFNWITSLNSTYVLTMDNYAATRTFVSEDEGRKTLRSWSWKGGYETGYAPEGYDTAVLNGGYYVQQECHIFETEEGAQAAFAWMVARAQSIPAQAPVSMPAVGNESAAFVANVGNIGTSPVVATYHQVIFRRGNIVTIVLTKGAQGFMKVDTARELALITDQKALGQKPAIEPTPITNYTPPAGN